MNNDTLSKLRLLDASETDPCCEEGLIDYEAKMKAYSDPQAWSHPRCAVNGYRQFKTLLVEHMIANEHSPLYESDEGNQGKLAVAAVLVTEAEREALLSVFNFDVWDEGCISRKGQSLWYEACTKALKAIP